TYDIAPDLMPMAKGLSSGYLPISAVAMRDEFFRVINDGGAVVHGFTYSGHPVACAVALANIELMQRENLVAHVRDDVGPYLHQCLQELARGQPIVGEIRGVGLIAAIQLVKDRNSRAAF